MHTDIPGLSQVFQELSPGTAFRFGLGDRIHFAIKAGRDNSFGAVILNPKGLTNNNDPIFILESELGYPVFAIPDLRLMVSTDTDDIAFSPGIRERAGRVYIYPRQEIFLAFLHGAPPRVHMMNIKTGEVPTRVNNSPIEIGRWALVFPIGDRRQTLFSYPPDLPTLQF